MERIKRWTKKILCSTRYHSSRSHSRLGYWLVVIAGCAFTVGCTTLKKAGVTSLGAGTGAIVGSVLSSGALAPIAGATTGAFVTSAVTDLTITGKTGKVAMNDCAPDNFWSLLGSLVEMGGWLLILIVIVPMIFSWLLPGPIQFKKKKGR